MRRIGRIGSLAALACVLAFPASAHGSVRSSSFLDRVTVSYRATASCYDRPDWAALVRSGYPSLRGHETAVYGLWLYEVRQVALPVRGCTALERWRTTSAAKVSLWLFVLGHELTHTEQTDFYNAPWSRPFDEVEADCGGYAKFERLRLGLGIRRKLSPPPRYFTRCPLKQATLRR